MVESTIIKSIQTYMENLHNAGIDPSFSVLFGSCLSGHADQWSDIDILVVSPRFDFEKSHQDVCKLWRVAARTDKRIEPIPCGEIQWKEDEQSPLIEQVRREGLRIDRKLPHE